MVHGALSRGCPSGGGFAIWVIPAQVEPFGGFIRVRGVTRNELQELRCKYRSAYTLYMHCVHDLADASEREERLSDQVHATEGRVFNDLALARQALLKALMACGRPDQDST